LGHLELVVEVADRSKPLDDHRDAVVAAVVDDQAVEAVDAHVAVLGGDFLEHFAALVDAEHARLRLVDEHRHDQLVIELGRPSDDVEVAVRDGVERARTHRTTYYVFGAHDGLRPYQSIPSPYRLCVTRTMPSGHLGSVPRADRSMTIIASSASQRGSSSVASRAARWSS